MENHVCTLDTVTGKLTVNSVLIPFRSVRDTNNFHFFFIFQNSFLYKIAVSFTMVIKRSPGGESAGGGRSTSKSTCVVPAWALIAFGDRPASSICPNLASACTLTSKMVLGRNPWRWACRSMYSSWKYTRVWSYQLTFDLRNVYFLDMLCNGCVRKQFRSLRSSQEACGAPPRRALLFNLYVCCNGWTLEF